MIEAFSKHYAFFDERNVEWSELVAETRAELTPDATESQLWDVMGELVAHVDDAHVSLEAEIDGDEAAHYTGAGSTLTRLEEQAEAQGIDIDDASVNFRGFMVPKGTPIEVTDVLAQRLPAMFGDEQVVTRMREGGASMRIMGRDEVQSLWQRHQAALEALLADLED